MYLSLHYTDTANFLYGPNVKQLENGVGYFGSHMAISFSAWTNIFIKVHVVNLPCTL